MTVQEMHAKADSGDQPVPKILLAEDNPADVYLIREALREHGVDCALHVASDGKDVLGLISACIELYMALNYLYDTGKLVGEVAKAVGGKGGGRPDMAEGAGRDINSLPSALEGVYERVGALL